MSEHKETLPPALLDYHAAAPILGCTPRMVRKLVETRQLDSVKVGRLVRIPPDAIATYIKRHRREAMDSGGDRAA